MSYAEFPYDRLPKPMASIVHYGAKAIGCDKSYLAIAALCMIGGILGGSRRLMAKRNWLVPPILWGVLLGESGTSKSPALKMIRKPLDEWERKELHFWERAKENAEALGQPVPRRNRRIQIRDTTVEALMPLAKENPLGLLLVRDELAGLLESFNCYKKQGGGDEAFFLSAFDGESHSVDRKRDREHIFVPSVSLSILGGIQPGIFARLMCQKHRESGLLARFLIVNPPSKAKRRNDAEVSDKVEAEWKEVVCKLIDLEMAQDENGNTTPLVIPLAPAAKSLFWDFYDSHNLALSEESGTWRSFLAKAEQLPLRLALILHHVRWASGEQVDVTEVDEKTMKAAIDLTRWFIDEASRIYGELDTSEEDRQLQQMEDWMKKNNWRTSESKAKTFGPNALRAKAGELLRLLYRNHRATKEWIESSEIGGRPFEEYALVGAPPRNRLPTDDDLRRYTPHGLTPSA
jgi:hypothetical protein